MTARHVTWFLDPEQFLRHVADFGIVKVAPFCQSCYEKGLPEEVSAVFNPTLRVWTVSCECAGYPVIVDRGDGQVLTIHQPTESGVAKVIPLYSVDELLQTLGWSFKCTADCARLGMADGIEALNDSRSTLLRINCGCTERLYQDGLVAS